MFFYYLLWPLMTLAQLSVRFFDWLADWLATKKFFETTKIYK